MSENHSIAQKTITCNLQPMEAHLASLCVAILFGALGGLCGIIALKYISIKISLIFSILAGFLIPWIICKYIFKTAHQWYGQNSLSHRAYDSIGIITAVIIFYLNK